MSGNNLNYQRDINNRGEPMAQRSQNGAAFVSVVDPITGMPSIGATTTSAGVDRSVTTSTTSSQLMAANTARRGLFIVNDTAIDVWINFGATAVAAAGSGNIKIGANGGRYESGAFTPSTAINIIAASGTPAITAREFIAVSASVADAPVIGAATAGREAATLAFTPGASNGGYTVQDYLISAYDSLTNVRFNTFTATSSPATLAPIPAGISAYFKVQARTPNGYSPQSGASVAVNIMAPFAAPGSPVGVAVSGGVGTASVTYTAPELNGGSAITSYRSTLYRVSDGSVVDVVTGTGTLTHSGLTGGYAVYARVEAANVPAGYGKQSVPSAIAVLPANSVTPGAYIGPISQRNRLPNFPATTATFKQMMTWQFRDNVSLVPAGQKIYINYTNVMGTSEAFPASAEIAAYIEYPQGTYTKFKTSGGADLAILTAPSGYTSLEGVLAVDLPEGARFWVGTWVNWTGSGANSVVYQTDNVNRLGTWTTACRESCNYSNTTVPDTGLTGVRGANNDGVGFNPISITSLTTKPTICIIGDSQERGSASTIDTNPEDGLVGQAERRWTGYGTINVAVSGDSYASAFVAQNFQARATVSQGCTHLHDGYGANDSGNMTWETMLSYIPAVKAKYPGCIYMHSTFDPKATSTDYYTTLENQTTAASWTEQNRINGFLRAKASPLIDIVLDDAATIESSPGAGTVKLSPNTKTVTYSGTINSGASSLTMPAGFFSDAVAVGAATPARLRRICIKGAGAGGADFVAYTRYVSDTNITFAAPTSTALPAATTSTTVSNPVIIFCILDYMLDGTGPHRSPFGEQLNQGLGFPA